MNPSAWTCVPPQSSIECSPASSTRTRSPYLSPKNAMAPRPTRVLLRRLVVAHGRVGDDLGVGQGLDPGQVGGGHAPRSARSRSAGARDRPSEPACCTWVPSTSRNAQWRTWVAVWLRRIASRRAPSMRAVTASPSARLPASTVPTVDHQARERVLRVGDPHPTALGRLEHAGVTDLPAALGVERGAVEDHRDRTRRPRPGPAGRGRPRSRAHLGAVGLVLLATGEVGGPDLVEQLAVEVDGLDTTVDAVPCLRRSGMRLLGTARAARPCATGSRRGRPRDRAPPRSPA